MASEALLDRFAYTTLTGLEAALKFGNNRSSKFTDVQAAQFASEWSVVDHKPNTSTGFSGTLFRNNATGELVISFRSTEFNDDNARDNMATNNLEIKEKGWAFGQIDDMQQWYANLRATGKIDKQLTVTGYSLGGHLAAAFNELNKGDRFVSNVPVIAATYTFNGAGVGETTNTATLTQVTNKGVRLH
jgi:hypothetical protein